MVLRYNCLRMSAVCLGSLFMMPSTHDTMSCFVDVFVSPEVASYSATTCWSLVNSSKYP